MSAAQPMSDRGELHVSSCDGGAALARLGIALVAVAAMALHAWSFLPFLSDDALISLRYSERLLEGHGLTWTAGPRVEGYTNLLWVLACAAWGWLGGDLIVGARGLGIAGMAAAVGAIAYAARGRRAGELAGAAGAALAFAAAGPVAVWAVGGLEQPMVVGLLAWAVALLVRGIDEPPRARATLLAGACLGLICLTRADGAVLCVAVGLGVLVPRQFGRAAWRQVILLAIFPILLGGGQVAFRLAYYGEWLPNPARVKVAFTLGRVLRGIYYDVRAVPFLAGIALPAIAAVAVRRAPAIRRRVAMLTVPLAAWCGYVALVGGDIFPAHRHLVPAVLLGAMLAGEWLAWLAGLAGRGPIWRRRAWVLAVALPAAVGLTQRLDPHVRVADRERWEWEGKAVGELLRTAFGGDGALLACDPAGCLPYFSKLDSIDMLGLNDQHIARHPPATFGHGRLAHELGDGKYVLDREPDLIVWTFPTGDDQPAFPSAIQMASDPRFARRYRLIHVTAAGPPATSSRIWMWYESPRIGIRQTADDITIPGWLAAESVKTPAGLDAAGRMGAWVTRAHPGLMRGITVPPGRWEARVDADRAVRVTVTGTALVGSSSEDSSGAPFVVPVAGPVDLRVATDSPGQVQVRSVRLRRVR